MKEEIRLSVTCQGKLFEGGGESVLIDEENSSKRIELAQIVNTNLRKFRDKKVKVVLSLTVTEE